ncbi:hypothetical protein [Novosphingobium sp. EMRT-2]|uniref:hypothetical protein n=1 Tax=Novosphingobium sp. EMRT-2 TaxID=2571749 RepID=UPI00143CFCE4
MTKTPLLLHARAILLTSLGSGPEVCRDHSEALGEAAVRHAMRLEASSVASLLGRFER